MLPWTWLKRWADDTGIHVDALGLITLLGADEVNAVVGRLVKSRYTDFLPLLGAHVIAGNSFTKKTPGFQLYNISSGFLTTELAGWLSRWLKAQDFHQIHHIVEWEIKEQPRTAKEKFMRWFIGFCLLGFVPQAMLIILTVLAGDWYGLATVSATIWSVVVRRFLLSQNHKGVDNAIQAAGRIADKEYQEAKKRFDEEKMKRHQEEPSDNDTLSASDAQGTVLKRPQKPREPVPPKNAKKRDAKIIVIMDDSKVVTMKTKEYLIAKVFAGNPEPPNPWMYNFMRWVGWLAFAVQIVTIGNAQLLTQICIVVLLSGSTIATVSKVGSEDSKFVSQFKAFFISLWQYWKEYVPEDRKLHKRESTLSMVTSASENVVCWIGSQLKATCKEYELEFEESSFNNDEKGKLKAPLEFEWGEEEFKQPHLKGPDDLPEHPPMTGLQETGSVFNDELQRTTSKQIPQRTPERDDRRRCLYVWLDLSWKECESMCKWDLMPHRREETREWWDEYIRRRRIHTQKLLKRKEVQSRQQSTMQHQKNEKAVGK